jgi:CSLREA domain-containing protein
MARMARWLHPALLFMVAAMLWPATPAAAAATIEVNTFADEYTEGATTCSLREAITAAQSDNDFDGCDQMGTYGDDTILLPVGTYTLSRSGAEDTGFNDLDVVGTGGALTIQSQGGTAQDTIIQAGTIGVSGPGTPNGIDRVLQAFPNSTVTLRDLTLRNGNDTSGDGGGAILHEGTSLTLERVAVRNSTTVSGNGGGGIWANEPLNLRQVEISGNESGSSGGGIHQFDSSLHANNLTVSGNEADDSGGGIEFTGDDSGFSGIAGSTITNNRANDDDTDPATGGGLNVVDGDVFVTGSIVAGNTLGTGGTNPDCSGPFNPFGAHDGNVIGNATGCTGFLAGDIGLDPQIQSLALNMPGFTMTHAIPTSSPAVDRWAVDGGPNDDGCLTSVGKFSVTGTDQRGVTRAQGPACDSGAYEVEVQVPGVCKGKQATLTGTAGAETLTGTKGNDVIAALGGNDTVKAGKGKDLVCGGDGNDKLNGSAGNDKLLGEAGNDKLKGGGGNDKMVGAKGNDKCSGAGGTNDKAKKCERSGGVP